MIDLSSGIVGSFRVDGRPRTKGSMKCVGQKGKHVLIEDHKLSGPWKAEMVKVIREEILDYVLDLEGRDWTSYAGPVEVRAVFFFKRENDVRGHVIPSHQTPYPTTIGIGDLDKLGRNLLDALEESGLLVNDKNVCLMTAEKRWAAPNSEGGVQVSVLCHPSNIPDVSSIDEEAREYWPTYYGPNRIGDR